MTNIEVRTQNIYENLSNAEKKVASYFLDNVENVFAKPISQLAEESGVSKVAWVRFCKAIGFDGLKDLKKSLFSELHETAVLWVRSGWVRPRAAAAQSPASTS